MDSDQAVAQPVRNSTPITKDFPGSQLICLFVAVLRQPIGGQGELKHFHDNRGLLREENPFYDRIVLK